MKRLLIYFFYDKDGIVDDYVYYFLDRMKSFSEHICFVVNGKLSSRDSQRIYGYVDDLLIRDNQGMDAYAYKYAISYYGYDKVKEYDEIVLTNYTFFGPIFPMSKIFNKMDGVKCDWWGLHSWFMKEPVEYKHIPSSFVAYRKRILESQDFKEYWETLADINTYADSVLYHEQRQTPYYDERGYKSATYLDENICENYNDDIYWPLLHADELLIKQEFPLLKRRVFFEESGKIKYINTAISCIQFLKNLSLYDYKLIKQNLQRTQNYNRLIIPNIFNKIVWFIKSKISKDIKRQTKYANKYVLVHNNIYFKKLLGVDTRNKFLLRLIAPFYKSYTKNNKKIVQILFIKFKKNLKKCNNSPLYRPDTASLGKHSYSGADIFIANPKGTYIGNFVSIGNCVRLGHGEHPLNYLSTSPYTYFDELKFKSPNMRSHPEFWHYKPVVIGHDVWIGDNVFIKNGIHIGNGAIIGAGAIVTKDVPPYAIVTGVPAKVMKYRFDENTIKKLLDLEWWFLPDEIIKQIPYDDIDEAIKFLENQKEKEYKNA